MKQNNFSSIIRNSATLIQSYAIGTALAFFAFILTANYLNISYLGYLAIIEGCARIIFRILDFQTELFIIKFGSIGLKNKDNSSLQTNIKFGLIIDIIVAILAYTCTQIVLAIIASLAHWPAEIIIASRIYCFWLLFNWIGTATGLLRLTNQFTQLGLHRIAIAMLKLILIFICINMKSGFIGIATAWMVTEVISTLSLILLSKNSLSKIGCPFHPTQTSINFKSMFKQHRLYLWSTNLSNSIQAIYMELDLIIVGLLVGADAAGLLKVAKQFAHLLLRLAQPINEALYPALNQLWNNRNYKSFKQLITLITILLTSLSLFYWICFIVAGQATITTIIGASFSSSYSTAVVYIFAFMSGILLLPYSSMVLSTGHAFHNLIIMLISIVFYIPLLFLFIHLYGIIGTAWAILFLFTAALTFYIGWRIIWLKSIIQNHKTL